MTDFIIESNMKFLADHVFHIEESAAYKNIGDCVKTVDLIRRKKEKIVFIEAKTSYPNPSLSDVRFDEESSNIVDKFVHSLNLLASISLGLRSDDITSLENLTNNNSQIVFLLVIRDHQKKWCPKVRDKLQLSINQNLCLQKIWRAKVFVINSEQAKRWGFITEHP